MWDKRFVLLLFVFGFVSFERWAHGSQHAQVATDHVVVYQTPSRGSQQVATLEKGAIVDASSHMIKDTEGSYWYVIRLTNGALGYVAANDVLPAEIGQSLRQAKIGHNDIQEEVVAASPWHFLVRGMGGPGAEAGGGAFEVMGEGEVSVCIPIEERGFMHQMFSLGAAYLVFPYDTAVVGSVVVRIYEESRVIPEFRFRLGESTTTNLLMGGVNLGINYPFSLYYGLHVSGYAEAGTLLSLAGTASNGSAVYHLWGSLGLGLHF